MVIDSKQSWVCLMQRTVLCALNASVDARILSALDHRHSLQVSCICIYAAASTAVHLQQELSVKALQLLQHQTPSSASIQPFGSWHGTWWTVTAFHSSPKLCLVSIATAVLWTPQPCNGDNEFVRGCCHDASHWHCIRHAHVHISDLTNCC